MRFVVSGELSRNRLLQVIVVLYVIYVAGLWVTNAGLYFSKMGLGYASVVEYYLGSEERLVAARSAQSLLEVSHFHLFAMGMLLLVLTHLMLFVPLGNGAKLFWIVAPYAAALLDEASGWAVRFVHPAFAYAKIAGFLSLQATLAGLCGISLWSVLGGGSSQYRSGEGALAEEDET
jgi:hypothetical protein